VGGGAKEFHSPPATRSNEETLPKLTVINKYVGQISPNSSMKRSLNCFVVFIFCIASYDHIMGLNKTVTYPSVMN
jgi:hypothetical protein